MENKRKKKYKKFIFYIAILIFVVFFLNFLWDGFFSNVLPWTKTKFSSYEKYEEMLDDQHFYATYRFVDEIPQNASSVKYYMHRDFREKYAAHSFVLAKEEYKGIIENQMIPYYECCDDEATLGVLLFNCNST